MITKELQKQTLSLKPIDKIRPVEILLENLDKTDPEIEAAWVAESERKYAVVQEGGNSGFDFGRGEKTHSFV